MGGPVERAEEGTRGDGRIGRPELAAGDAVGDERADAALVAITLRDDRRAQAAGQGIDLEVRGRAFHLIDEAEDVGGREPAQPIGHRTGVAARLRQRGEQLVERPILTEEQELVLAAEVVVQVAGREVRGAGNLAHAGGGEAALPEDAGRGLEDLDAPRVRSF